MSKTFLDPYTDEFRHGYASELAMCLYCIIILSSYPDGEANAIVDGFRIAIEAHGRGVGTDFYHWMRSESISTKVSLERVPIT